MPFTEPFDLNSWGRPDRFYADEKASIGMKEKQTSFWDVEQILKDYDPELPKQVERAFKRWNSTIRDYLRNETALRLSTSEGTRAVPVRVVAGMPKPFEQAIAGETDVLWLLLNQALINQTAKGIKWIGQHYNELSKPELLKKPVAASSDNVKMVREFVDQISERIAQRNLIDRIKKIEEDVLGAYFFRVPRIDLYWMVIGIMAATLGVTVEGLTVVVAAHELAHAYSHVGMDIDGEYWDTNAFAKADIGIVEGLSQFYTAIVCEKLKHRIPSALKAYKKLLDFQTGPYLSHLDWSENDLSAGEIIRVSMIQCRSQNVTKYTEFKNVLEKHREGIKRRARMR
jgi:hypothetical protein